MLLFIAKDYEKVIHLSSEETFKVVVNKFFAIEELFYTHSQQFSYLALLVNKGKTCLFKGNGPELDEIIDNKFPAHYQKEAYEKEHQDNHVLHSKDPSEVNYRRTVNYWTNIDHMIKPYINGEPLFLLGDSKQVGIYKQITHHRQFIADELHIDCGKSKLSLSAIAQHIWPLAKKFQQSQQKKIIDMGKEFLASKAALHKPDKIWEALAKTTTPTFLITKGYQQPAYINKN